MDYKEFCKRVNDMVNQELTGIKASLYTAVKNNGKEQTGVLIKATGINVSPVIYLEEYYNSYLAGKPLSNIVKEFIENYESVKKEESWDCSRILTYGGVKDRIVFKLINTDKNKKFLSTVPHKAFLNLSIVFYIVFEVTDGGMAAMPISNSHAKLWKVGTETLWQDAAENVRQLLPAEMMTMENALQEMLGKSTEYSNVPQIENLLTGGKSRNSMYVLSNSFRNYGAACFAYPSVMETIGNILKSDYYIIPSSVHEVVIIPYSLMFDADELNKMLREINKEAVLEQDILGDRCYLYSIEKKKITEM